MIPIVYNYDFTKVIGTLRYEDDQFFMSFTEDSHVTEDSLFKILNGGIIILEWHTVEEVAYLKEVQILHLSYP